MPAKRRRRRDRAPPTWPSAAPGRDPRFRSCRRGARAGADGPLRGIAVGIKDIIDTADMPTEMGSPIYAGWRPQADAAIVTALPRAGATRSARPRPPRWPISTRRRRATRAIRPYARRLLVGLGGGGRGRHGPARARDADRRLGDPPGVVLRLRRDQAVVPAAPDGRREMLFLDPRHPRPVRRHRAPTSPTRLPP